MDLGGRPKHSISKQGEFEPQKLPNGKYGALCSMCKKVLANTAEQRLKNHRKNCPLKNATVNICSDQNININYNVCDEYHNHLNETNLGEVQSTTYVDRPGGKYNYLCRLLSIIFFNCWLIPSQVFCISYLSNCIGSELSSKIKVAMQTSSNVWNSKVKVPITGHVLIPGHQ